jgi:hypothetical protein
VEMLKYNMEKAKNLPEVKEERGIKNLHFK